MAEKITNIYRHRGLKDPEDKPNSFESILNNYRGNVEFDTFLLRDGNIAVIHERDFNMSREEIENLDLKELESLKIKSSEKESDQSVPLMTEFLNLSADADLTLALEIRSSTPEKSLALTKKILEQILEMEENGGLKDNPRYVESRVNFQSFSLDVLRLIKATAKENNKNFYTTLYWPSDEKWAKVSGVFDWESLHELDERHDLDWHKKGIEIASRNNLSEIEFQPHVLTTELIEEGHRHNLKVTASLTNDEEMIKKLIEMGVDSIKTEK